MVELFSLLAGVRRFRFPPIDVVDGLEATGWFSIYPLRDPGVQLPNHESKPPNKGGA